MSENKNVTITVNLIEGSISISGSEEFVEKNMENVFTFVNETSDKYKMKEAKYCVPDIETPEKEHVKVEKEKKTCLDSETKKGEKYINAGIYSVDPADGTILIHKKIPGSNKADKMKNIAYIVLFERGEAVESSEIKALCEKQACWDSKNVSAIFERDIENFIKKKISAHKWTIELTVQGESSAKELLEEMLGE